LLINVVADLLLQATFKGWMDIMYDAIDSREVRNAMVNAATILQTLAGLLQHARKCFIAG